MQNFMMPLLINLLLKNLNRAVKSGVVAILNKGIDGGASLKLELLLTLDVANKVR